MSAGIIAPPESVAPLREGDGSLLDDLLVVPAGLRHAARGPRQRSSTSGRSSLDKAEAACRYHATPLPGSRSSTPGLQSPQRSETQTWFAGGAGEAQAEPARGADAADLSDAGGGAALSHGSAESPRGWSPAPISQTGDGHSPDANAPAPQSVPPADTGAPVPKRRLQALLDTWEVEGRAMGMGEPPARVGGTSDMATPEMIAVRTPLWSDADGFSSVAPGSVVPLEADRESGRASSRGLAGVEVERRYSTPRSSLSAARPPRPSHRVHPMGCGTAEAWATRLGMDVSSAAPAYPSAASPSLSPADASPGRSSRVGTCSVPLGAFAMDGRGGSPADGTIPYPSPARRSLGREASASRHTVSPQRVGHHNCANCARSASQLQLRRGASGSAGRSTPRSRAGGRQASGSGLAFGRSVSGGRAQAEGADCGLRCHRPCCAGKQEQAGGERAHSHTPTRRKVPGIEAKLEARAGGVEVWNRLVDDADLRLRNAEATARLVEHRKEVAEDASLHPPNHNRPPPMFSETVAGSRTVDPAWLARPRRAAPPPELDPTLHTFRPALSEGTRSMAMGSGGRVWNHLAKVKESDTKSAAPVAPKEAPCPTRSKEHMDELSTRLYVDATKRESRRTKQLKREQAAITFKPQINGRSGDIAASRADRKQPVHVRMHSPLPARREHSAGVGEGRGAGSKQLFTAAVGGTHVMQCPDVGGQRVSLIRKGDTVVVNTSTLLHVGGAVWGETAGGWCAVVQANGTRVLVPAAGDGAASTPQRSQPRPAPPAPSHPPSANRQQHLKRREELAGQLEALRHMT